MSAQTGTLAPAAAAPIRRAPRKINWMLLSGSVIMLAIILFGLIGPWFYDTDLAKVGAVIPSQPPSAEHPLGTDVQGSDILAVLMLGTPQHQRRRHSTNSRAKNWCRSLCSRLDSTKGTAKS